MDVNDDDGCLTPRVAWTTIASKLGSYSVGVVFVKSVYGTKPAGAGFL